MKIHLLLVLSNEIRKERILKAKLIKGPDRFVEIVKFFALKNDNLIVLLTGYRRQYVIKRLEEENIQFKYIEMVDIEKFK